MRLTSFFALLLLSFSSWAQMLTADQALTLSQQANALLIDVRSQEEFQAGALPGALNIPHNLISQGVEQRAVEKDTPIILYCRSGRRSGMAEQELRARGYTQIYNAGGYESLKATFAPSAR